MPKLRPSPSQGRCFLAPRAPSAPANPSQHRKRGEATLHHPGTKHDAHLNGSCHANHQFSRIQRQSAYYFSHTQPLQRGGAASARGLNLLKRWRSKRQPTLWRSKRRQTLWSYKRLPTLWRSKRQLSRGAWSASSGGAPQSPSPHQGRRFLSHFSAAVSPGSARDMACKHLGLKRGGYTGAGPSRRLSCR